MEDNLDILKQQWQQLSARTAALEDANRKLAAELAHSKVTPLQEKLAARISRMGWVSLIMPLLAPLLYYELYMPWWVALLYAVFGLLMSVVNFWLGEYVRERPLAELPVADAIRRASRIKLHQIRQEVIGLSLCFALITTMAICLPDGPEREPMIIGGAVGFVIGMAIGIHRFLANLRLSRQLLASLADA